MNTEKLIQIYEVLYARFGPQDWWPGETTFEIIVGAILTQNTNWVNVEKAISNLKSGNCLAVDKLRNMDIGVLAELIRPAGYYNIKAKRLKNFIDHLCDNYDGGLEELGEIELGTLRESLLSVNGIGRETADSILLYAFEKPVFVVDAYTCRVIFRHELMENEADYEQVREFFEDNLPQDAKLFNEYHALLVRVGKEYCRPKARCQGCPLENLPHSLDEEFG